MTTDTSPAHAMPSPTCARRVFLNYVIGTLGHGQATCDSDNPIEGIELDGHARRLYDDFIAAINAANGH